MSRQRDEVGRRSNMAAIAMGENAKSSDFTSLIRMIGCDVSWPPRLTQLPLCWRNGEIYPVRILLVEDEVKLAESLKAGLEDDLHTVILAQTGEEGFFP